MPSASERASVIDEFIAAELAAGSVLGPIDQVKSKSILGNRFGLAPKRHSSGR